MFLSRPVAALVSLFLATTAIAENNPVVIELFTSQGCSSCPPADRIMHELAERDDVIGLALHVDYWDYIGWEDEYAKPSHTIRQRAYARSGGRSMIYTPQMVVNGQQDVVGAQVQELNRLIDAHLKAAPKVSVKAVADGETTTVQVTPVDLSGGDRYDVRLVHYAPMRHASIRRGELAGHELDYANVVESWHMVGQWDGTETREYTFALESDLPAVVIVQSIGHGPILAATRVD